MKCPYQTTVIHKPQYEYDRTIYYAQDITKFGDCIEKGCPYYENGSCLRVKMEIDENTSGKMVK